MKNTILLFTLLFICSIGYSQSKSDIDLLIEKSNSGDMKSRFELSQLYTTGKGVPLDKGKGIKLLAQSALGGYLEAQTTIASLYIDSERYRQAFFFLELAADQGHAISQFLVATYYHNGVHGVDQDYTKAFKYYKMAANQENSEAQYIVGQMYYVGKMFGLEENIDKSITWLRKASEQGHPKAKKLLQDIQKVLSSKQTKDLSSKQTNIEIRWMGDWKYCNEYSQRKSKCKKRDFSTYNPHTSKWSHTNKIVVLQYSDGDYQISVWIGTEEIVFHYYPSYNGFSPLYRNAFEQKGINVIDKASNLDNAINYSIQFANKYTLK